MKHIQNLKIFQYFDVNLHYENYYNMLVSKNERTETRD